MASLASPGSPKTVTNPPTNTSELSGTKRKGVAGYCVFESGDLAAAGYRLYKFGDLYDLQLQSQGRTIGVHRCIVAQRCRFFQAAINGPFKEGQTGVLKMDDDDPDALELLVIYLYTQKLYSLQIFKDSYAPLKLNLEVIKIADKYDLPNLMGLAADKFSNELLRVGRPGLDEQEFAFISEAFYLADSKLCDGLRNLKEGDIITRLARAYTFDEKMQEVIHGFATKCLEFATDLLGVVGRLALDERRTRPRVRKARKVEV